MERKRITIAIYANVDDKTAANIAVETVQFIKQKFNNYNPNVEHKVRDVGDDGGLK